MKVALMITFIFLVLLTLSFLTFSLLTAIRKAEFEEAVSSPVRDETNQEE
ncbi:hypothetical protein [Brevibacillus sp. H7]